MSFVTKNLIIYWYKNIDENISWSCAENSVRFPTYRGIDNCFRSSVLYYVYDFSENVAV